MLWDLQSGSGRKRAQPKVFSGRTGRRLAQKKVFSGRTGRRLAQKKVASGHNTSHRAQCVFGPLNPFLRALFVVCQPALSVRQHSVQFLAIFIHFINFNFRPAFHLVFYHLKRHVSILSNTPLLTTLLFAVFHGSLCSFVFTLPHWRLLRRTAGAPLVASTHYFGRCAQRVCVAACGACISLCSACFELAVQSAPRSGGDAATACARCAAARRLTSLRCALRKRDFMRSYKHVALQRVSPRSS